MVFVNFFIIIALIFGLLLLSEYLFHRKIIHQELNRKLVHMGTGVIVAFSPYFITWTAIQILSLAFLVVILFSLKFKVFNSIHAVKRVTRGEILYAVGIGVAAFLEPAVWIFTAAILHLAIADAVAAVVGVRWGKRTKYVILSHGKTMLGSMAFFYTSMLIMFCAFLFVDGQNLPNLYLLLLVAPAILTLLENVSWYGLDNVTIPLMVIVILSTGNGGSLILV